MISNNEEFKERLKKLRTSHQMKQDDLAKAMNVVRTSVSAWETGRNAPPPDVLARLADFFNVSVDYLLGKTDDPSPSEERKWLNSLLSDPNIQMNSKVRDAIEHGILQSTTAIPYIEKLDPAKEIKEQMEKTEKVMIVPTEIPLDFATPALDDMLEPEYLKTDILLCRLYKPDEELPQKGVGIFFRNMEVYQRVAGKQEFEPATFNDVLARKFIISQKDFVILSITNSKYGIEENNVVLPIRKIGTEYKLVAIVMGMFRIKNDTTESEKS